MSENPSQITRPRRSGAVTIIRPSTGRVAKKSRELIKNTGNAPITSCNLPVGGERDKCIDNKRMSLIYELLDDANYVYSDLSWVYKKYFSMYYPEQLLWFFFDEPDRAPNEENYKPTVSNLSEENSLPIVVKKNYKFTDNSKHDVLSINYPVTGMNHKIKYGGVNEDLKTPWFYIEKYDGPNKPMKRLYGAIASINEGVSSFGKKKKKMSKLSSDLEYLLKL
jgi:hypothetical protein